MAPRVAEAAMRVALDGAEPPVEVRVVRARFPVAEMLPCLGDHRLGRAEAAASAVVGLAALNALALDALVELLHPRAVLLVVLQDDPVPLLRCRVECLGHQ